MSPTTSVSFLDVNMTEWTGKPPSEATGAAEAYVVEFLRQAYQERGSMDWSSKTGGWLLVRLMTKLLCVPHGPHSGRTVPEIQQAYLPLVRDLVGTKLFSFAGRSGAGSFQRAIPATCGGSTTEPRSECYLMLLRDASAAQWLPHAHSRSWRQRCILMPYRRHVVELSSSGTSP